MPIVLYPGNTNGVRVRRLRDALSGTLLNNLTTVSGSLRNEDGTALATPVNFGFTYTPGTKGEYVAEIPATAAIVAGAKYLVFVEVDESASLTAHFEFEAVAQPRKKG